MSIKCQWALRWHANKPIQIDIILQLTLNISIFVLVVIMMTQNKIDTQKWIGRQKKFKQKWIYNRKWIAISILDVQETYSSPTALTSFLKTLMDFGVNVFQYFM